MSTTIGNGGILLHPYIYEAIDWIRESYKIHGYIELTNPNEWEIRIQDISSSVFLSGGRRYSHKDSINLLLDEMIVIIKKYN